MLHHIRFGGAVIAEELEGESLIVEFVKFVGGDGEGGGCFQAGRSTTVGAQVSVRPNF